MIATAPAMPDQFVPLKPAAVVQPAPFSAFEVKVMPQGAAVAAFQPLQTKPADQPPVSESCTQPVITLQRDGDIVSRIRIQCGCGRIVDLDCSY
jgi:hypothetical protein